MSSHQSDRIIIVEGLTDKKRLEKVIEDQVTIICTNGTFDVERFDEMLETYQLDDKEVYIFVDEDKSGLKLRKQLSLELPHAEHIYVSSEYREVAATPERILAMLLLGKQIAVNPHYLV